MSEQEHEPPFTERPAKTIDEIAQEKDHELEALSREDRQRRKEISERLSKEEDSRKAQLDADKETMVNFDTVSLKIAREKAVIQEISKAEERVSIADAKAEERVSIEQEKADERSAIAQAKADERTADARRETQGPERLNYFENKARVEAEQRDNSGRTRQSDRNWDWDR